MFSELPIAARARLRQTQALCLIDGLLHVLFLHINKKTALRFTGVLSLNLFQVNKYLCFLSFQSPPGHTSDKCKFYARSKVYFTSSFSHFNKKQRFGSQGSLGLYLFLASGEAASNH